MNYLLSSLVLLPAEKLLNHLLTQDGHILKKLQPFNGKIVEVCSLLPTATLRISFQEQRVRLSSLDAKTLQLQVDATVSGKASDLVSLLLNPDSTPLANKAITISGDALFIQDLFTTLNALDVDWRDLLAPFFGDILTQEIGQMEEQARHWSVDAKFNLQRSVDEYLKEEIRLVPDSEEVARFSDELDQLKMALDRTNARALLLQARLDKSLKNQHLS